MTTNAEAPIGVFDSGVGGLSVLRAIRALLPHEDLLYVADSAHVPYGDKPAAFIEARAAAIVEFLLSQRAKAIVVACNTATSAAIVALRARFSLPIVAMEPAVKPAAAKSRSRIVGVLATSGTLGGDKFAELVRRLDRPVEILVQPCPGLVERVEAGDIAGTETAALLTRYVAPLLERGADTIVLGCTHFPFLTPLLQRVAGAGVAIVDPSAAVARELQRRLRQCSTLAPATRAGTAKFWTSGAPEHAARMLAQLWGYTAEVCVLPETAEPQECSVGP